MFLQILGQPAGFGVVGRGRPPVNLRRHRRSPDTLEVRVSAPLREPVDIVVDELFVPREGSGEGRRDSAAVALRIPLTRCITNGICLTVRPERSYTSW